VSESLGELKTRGAVCFNLDLEVLKLSGGLGVASVGELGGVLKRVGRPFSAVNLDVA